MGKTWENLTCEELCDLMCGKPEDDYDDFIIDDENTALYVVYMNYKSIRISKYMPKDEQKRLRKLKRKYKAEMEALRNGE